MAYQVFHSVMMPRKQPEPPNLAPSEFPTKDLALEAAFAFIEQNRIVWRIEGTDGFRMGRRDVDVYYNDKMGKWPSR